MLAKGITDVLTINCSLIGRKQSTKSICLETSVPGVA